jgi:hypothetical protein
MKRTLLITVLLLICQTPMAGTVQQRQGGQVSSRSAGSAVKEAYEGEALGRDTMADMLEGDLGATSVPFSLQISGYTSSQETNRYAQIVKTEGQEGLLQAIGAQNLGYFRISGQPERPVLFVQQSQNDTSRTIAVLCRRWLNTFIEGYEDRAAKFPFAYIEVTVDSCGRGDGTLYTGASVRFSSQTANIVNVACYDASVDIVNNPESIIAVEDYANSRDWLKNVRLNEAGLVQVQR